MKFTRFRTTTSAAVAMILAVACISPAPAFAQQRKQPPSSPLPTGPLVDLVRESTARFQDVEEARRAGYQLLFGCVSGGDVGAMGMHYVNTSLITDLEVDPTNPEIVIYEPQADGTLRLVGADFLIFADAWDEAHKDDRATPQLMGQLFHRFDAPNRFGLPNFYTLHVWAWKANPTGTYVNWHSGVSCDAFGGQP